MANTAALLPLWDLNACTLTIDGAAFDAAGIVDASQLAAAYGIPLQGPGGLNQAQTGTSMDPAKYFVNGTVLKMPPGACSIAQAQANPSPPPVAVDPTTPDPTHGADPTTPTDKPAGLSTGAMVGIGVATAAAVVGGYLLLARSAVGRGSASEVPRPPR